SSAGGKPLYGSDALLFEPLIGLLEMTTANKRNRGAASSQGGRVIGLQNQVRMLGVLLNQCFFGLGVSTPQHINNRACSLLGQVHQQGVSNLLPTFLGVRGRQTI